MKIKIIKMSFQASYKFQNLGGELEIEVEGLEHGDVKKEIDLAKDIALILQKQSYNSLKKEYDTHDLEKSIVQNYHTPSPTIEREQQVPSISPAQKKLATSKGIPHRDPDGNKWSSFTLSKAIKAKIEEEKSKIEVKGDW